MNEKAIEFLRRVHPIDILALVLALVAGGALLGMYSERARLYKKFKLAAEENKRAKDTAPAAAPAPTPETPAA